jgi:hypothetical protein
MPTKSDMMKTTSRMACVISQMSLFDVLANNMSSVSTAPFAGAVADHKDTIIQQENQPYCAPIGEPQLRAFADNDNGQSVNDLPPTGLVTIHKAQVAPLSAGGVNHQAPFIYVSTTK